jgi:hypothetical protein
MMADRAKLLGLLSRLDRAEAATNDVLKLDAGADADRLAELLGILIQEMRTTVDEMLGS